MPANAWEGDWEKRIRDRIQSLGCKSMIDFIAMFPSESYVDVAKRLGDDVAAVQVWDIQLREAAERGNLRAMAIDALVRYFHEYNKRGWNKGKHAKFRQAEVYASWKSMSRLTDPEKFNVIEKEHVWRALEESNPPEGWFPESVADPFIVAAFDKAWPKSTM